MLVRGDLDHGISVETEDAEHLHPHKATIALTFTAEDSRTLAMRLAAMLNEWKPPTVKPGFARDQYGEPWLVVERTEQLWAIGLAYPALPTMVLVVNNAISLGPSNSRPIRHLRQVEEK